MNSINTEDIAYIAGFFDGEGSIFISTARKKQNFLTASINNTNRDVLEFIKTRFGFGSISISPDKRSNHRTLYRLRLYSNQALKFLETIEPFLHVKHTQAVTAIAFQKTMVDGKHISDETRIMQENYKATINGFNMKSRRT